MFDLQQPDQFKHKVQASFDATDTAYGAPGDYHWEFAKRLVKKAPITNGQIILDVATGTAPAAILSSQIVGNRGCLIGIDISLGILKIASQHIKTTHSHTISLIASDTEYISLQDNFFDGVVCSSAIVWFPNIFRALQEWHRVAHERGWIAFSCFGGMARQTVVDLLNESLSHYGQSVPELNGRLNSPEKCHQLAYNAGFKNVTVYQEQHQNYPTDPEESFEKAWPSRKRFSINVTTEQREQIKGHYVRAFIRTGANRKEFIQDYEQHVIAYKSSR